MFIFRIIEFFSKIWSISRKKVSYLKAVDRLSVCSKCEYFVSEKDRCKITDSYMPLKVVWKDSECPEYQWGED